MQQGFGRGRGRSNPVSQVAQVPRVGGRGRSNPFSHVAQVPGVGGLIMGTRDVRVVNHSIGSLEAFDLQSGKWPIYKSRLDQYFIAQDVTEAERKVSVWSNGAALFGVHRFQGRTEDVTRKGSSSESSEAA